LHIFAAPDAGLTRLKLFIKYLLQRLLGFRRYLCWFAAWKVRTLHRDKKEKDFFVFMDLIPKEAGVIVDAGANLGVMSVHLGRRFPDAQVVAVEPMPQNYGVLETVVKKFRVKNVQLHKVALGDKPGVGKMVMPVEASVRQHGLCHMEEVADGEVVGERESVTIVKLDDLPMPDARVLAIKVDVENYEHKVLLGAREIIRRHRPVVYCELWDNQNRQDTLALMRELGYGVFCVRQGRVVAFDPKDCVTQNFIFQAGLGED
jgi:FkbM family methyltransferase